MRDDQLETVRRLHGELLKQDYISEQEDLALTALLTELREMRELLEAAKWIPVSERLPGKYGRYLVTRRRLTDGACLTREAFYDLEDGFTRTANPFPPISDVIAWMPKPDAYREVMKEGEGK